MLYRTLRLAVRPRIGSARLASSIAVKSPRDGKVFDEIPDWTTAEVDSAVARAVALRPSAWAAPSSVGDRATQLRALAGAVRRETDRLARLESLDSGKPIAEAVADMGACVDLLEYYAAIAPSVLGERRLALDDADFVSSVVPAPAGVVAAVTPWNYPLMQAVCKVAPALAAGCPTLLKPSPLASLTCIELGRMAAEEAGLPGGALTVVTGGPPDGAADGGAARLVAHPAVDLLSFTGSTRGGREMLAASAPLVRRTGLELGGKGAMVVFDDADVDAVVDWAMVGIFVCAGQICSATSRLLVQREIAPRLIEALRAATGRVRMGDPLDEGTQLGAMISEDAAIRVLAHVERAHAVDGATLLCGSGQAAHVGGGALDGGYYVEPTVLVDVPIEAAAWQEEIFGPVLCVRTFDTEEEAVSLANASPYGLGHAVMSADDERCERVAAALEAGTVWINCSQPLFPQTPFGGWKASGFGKEWGEEGMHEYLRHKTITKTSQGTSFSWKYYG
jgi:betaine-aldehyde dehydrogenase